MMYYYAKIEKENRHYIVEFPGLAGCLTEGKSLEEALKNAAEALSGWLAVHCDLAVDAPSPKKYKGKNYFPVAVDIQVEFALRLRQLRLKKKLSQSEVAKRLGISQQAYAKLEIPQSANPSLTTIAKLSSALEVEIEIKLVA